MRKLLSIVCVLIVVSASLKAQSWNMEGAAQFGSEPRFMETAIHPNTGELYVAYVDAADNDHLKVVKFDGTAWVNVGGTISQLGNVLFPSIRINPATGEPWVAYRTDLNSTTRSLMVRRFDGTTWQDEGSNIASTFFGFKTIPTQKIILRFSPSGNAFLAYSSPLSANSSNTFAVVVTNSSGSWATSTSGQSHTPYGMDFPSYRIIYDAVSFGSLSNPEVQLTRKVFNDNTETWSSPTNIGSDFPNPGRNYEGLSVVPNGTIAALHQFNSNTNVDILTWTGALADPANTESTQGRSIQFITNPVDGLRYLLYVKSTGDVGVATFDGSSWTEVSGLSVNVGSTTTTATKINALHAKLRIRESDGRVYVVHKDGTGISAQYIDVVPAPTRYYVDQSATGNNDGTSWADAFTDLQVALQATEGSLTVDTIWVASGTYKPTTSSSNNRNATFEIDKSGLKIFGGFSGTETELDQRNVSANPTILSGDHNGDDDPNSLAYFSNLRDDNSYNVVYLNASDVELNGFTIEGGHADLTGGADRGDKGAGTYMVGTVSNVTLLNNTFRYNIARVNGAVSLFFTSGGSKTVLVENCIFHDNISRYGSALSVLTSSSSTTVDVELHNSLVHHNTAKDLNFQPGFTGSIAMFTNGGEINFTAINNTFAYNVDAGTNTSNDKGTIVLRRNAAASSGQITAEIHNNIFFENYSDESGTVNTQQIGTMNTANQVASISFTHNNATQTNLASKALSVTENSNLNADPLFSDGTNGDFVLQSTSTMIDAGDNTKVPASITTDLNGVSRTINTTVDLGAYEYFLDNTAPTVVTKDITVSLDENGQVIVNGSAVNDGSTDDIVPPSSLSFSLDKDTFNCADLGANTVNLTVSDISGNAASASAVITVADELAPVAVAQDVTVELDSFGVATLTAVEVDNGSSDNCSIAKMRLLNDSTYDCSQRGQTLTNVLQVEDSEGNTSSVTFNITIEDNIAPVYVGKDITVELDSSGIATVDFDQLHDGLSDNCGVSVKGPISLSYDCSNLGPNEVPMFVNDSSGNRTRDTVVVTIVDQIAPVVVTQDIEVNLDENGNATITADQIDNGTSDNCSTPTLSLDITSFTMADEGQNVVTLTATDASGNSSSGTAVVTVVGNAAPAVINPVLPLSIDEDPGTVILVEDVTDVFQDPEGDSITYTVASSSVELTAVLADSTITVTPADNYFGMDTVTITATDANGNGNNLEVQVTINAINDAPFVANPFATLALNEDQGQVTVNIQNIFDDVEGDSLTYSFTNNLTAIEVELDTQNVRLVVDLIPDANGSGKIDIVATDGSESVINTVQVEVLPVNDAPEVTGTDILLDEDFQGSVVETINVEQPANESDQTITFSINPDPSSITWAAIAFDASAGSITLNSVADEFGSQTFIVTADDGQTENNIGLDTVLVTVNAVNDAPAFSLSETTFNLKEGFEGTRIISLTDLSPENEMESITYTLTPATVSFLDIAIDSQTGEISLSGIAGETGSQVFEVMAEDAFGATSVFENLSISVSPNQAPVVVETVQAQTFNEDFGTATISADVEALFEDPDGDELSFSVNSDNADISLSITNNVVQVSSPANYFGSANASITATDSELSVTIEFPIEVVAVNDIPVVAATLDDLILEVGFGFEEVELSGVFTDEDGDDLVLSASSSDEGVALVTVTGNTLTITEVQSGETTITVSADDSRGGSATISFMVTIPAITSVDHRNQLEVYPNPVRNQLSIESALNITAIQVMDMQGRILLNRNGKANKLDLSSFPKGQYLMIIKMDLETKQIKIHKL